MINIFSFQVKQENNPFFLDLYIREWSEVSHIRVDYGNRIVHAQSIGPFYFIYGHRYSHKQVVK